MQSRSHSLSTDFSLGLRGEIYDMVGHVWMRFISFLVPDLLQIFIGWLVYENIRVCVMGERGMTQMQENLFW